MALTVLMFLDLDNFKSLNDSKGHSLGDKLLQIVAQRLRAAVRSNDLVIRWGGDEFVILISNLASSYEDAEAKANFICDQITQKLNMPYELNDYVHHCRVSIRVEIFETLEADIDALVEHADSAMYKANRDPELQIAFHQAP